MVFILEVTESILTKMTALVKDYFAYFKKNLNIFFLLKLVLPVITIIVHSGGKCKGQI